MSFIQSTVQCQDCKEYYNVAFGVQGMTLMWSHPKSCSKCNGSLKHVSAGWVAEKLNNESKPEPEKPEEHHEL